MDSFCWRGRPRPPDGNKERNLYWDYNDLEDMQEINMLILNTTTNDYFSWLFEPLLPSVINAFNER